jgi:N-acetylmuramoyl-L-alanine amidase
MREINTAIIHCAATYARMNWRAEDIRRVHVDENGWSDIGYHFVVGRDGLIESGRDIKRPGAHAAGHNAKSIGVCIVGGLGDDNKAVFNFTRVQFKSLEKLIDDLRAQYPNIEVIGHRDVSKKECPSFDASVYFSL